MYKLSLTFLMLSIALVSFSQGQNETSDPKVFTIVEQQPEFPGGIPELMHFVRRNVQYPKKERKKGIEGRVIIRFVVDENGDVQDAHVTKSVSPGLDAEALRVVKLLPRFKPGYQQGRAVKVYYNLPISFKLT